MRGDTNSFTLILDHVAHSIYDFATSLCHCTGSFDTLILDTLKPDFINPLTLPVPCISESCIEINKLNFYFHTSLWSRKRFYEGTTKKVENKNLT